MLRRTCVITFANTDTHKKYQEEFNNLYHDKFGHIVNYTENDILGTEFYEENRELFSYRKYFGFFLWKPYLIHRTMSICPFDHILYCDSNLRFTNFGRFAESFNWFIGNVGTYLIKHAHFINKDWTKRDTFILMDADEERYWMAHQVWTPLMGFTKSDKSKMLIDEYLKYCKVAQIVTESESVLGKNLEGFTEHRWEQCVMSILAEKYSIPCESDVLASNWTTKLYSDSLLKMKEEINANPMAKSI